MCGARATPLAPSRRQSASCQGRDPDTTVKYLLLYLIPILSLPQRAIPDTLF